MTLFAGRRNTFIKGTVLGRGNDQAHALDIIIAIWLLSVLRLALLDQLAALRTQIGSNDRHAPAGAQ